MNRFALLLLLASFVALAGCATSDVKHSDLHPATTATVSGGTVTLHLGSDLTASATWTKTKTKVDGQTVYILGNRSLREQSRTITVPLPPTADSASVKIVWIDPDGRQVSVPIKKS